jgi:extradiol dioxygenase family protein
MRLLAAEVRFVVALEVQARGTDDERRKFVFLDPSNYAVEFKCYVNQARALAQAAAYPRLPARRP